VDEIKGKFKITEKDHKDYQTLVEAHGKKKARLTEIDRDITVLAPFLITKSNGTTDVREMAPTITFYPSVDSLPAELNTSVTKKVDEFKIRISDTVRRQIADYHTRLQS